MERRTFLFLGIYLSILVGSTTEASEFHTNPVPKEMIYYLSQWGVYGSTQKSGKEGPPYNWMTETNKANSMLLNGDTYIAGNFAGRFFTLHDIDQLVHKFFPEGTKKIINFSFAGIDMNTCEVKTVDFYADFQVGVGGNCGEKGKYEYSSAREGTHGHACAIKELTAKNYDIRLSIGGWTMSTEFSHCLKNEKFNTLVDSLQWHKDRYGFTGFDIDWESPGKQGCDGTDKDPCKFVVSRDFDDAIKYLKMHSDPMSYSHGEYSANPSYFIPIARSSTGSMDANNDNAEQCHSGDPGVPYRMCKDSRLVLDWSRNTDCGCQNSDKKINCMIEHSDECLLPSYKDCVKHYAQAVSSHPHCKEIAQLFSAKSGAEVKQYWIDYGSDKSKDWLNYVKLIKEIKKKYSNMAVTAAISMAPDLLDGELSPVKAGTSWKEFCEALDSVNVMTYDFYGAWGAPYHNAPLFHDETHNKSKNAGYNEKFNVDAALNSLLKNGCPASKINLGLPLYGRTYANSSGKLGDFGGIDSQSIGVGTYQKGSLSYWDASLRFFESKDGGKCDQSQEIKEAKLPTEIIHCGKWKLERDVKAGCVPWAWKQNNSLYDVISYDDKISIALKAKYAKCKGLKGLMFWDAADDKDAELSEVAWKAWQSVKDSECPLILAQPTKCENNGEVKGHDKDVSTKKPSNDDSDKTHQPDTGKNRDGSCSAFTQCVDECVHQL